MTNPSIDWNKDFPVTDGPGVSGYFEPGWSGEIMVKMTIIVPDDRQDYEFRWWQEYGGSNYQKDLIPGQNDLSFTLGNTSSEFGLVRALVFVNSGTFGVEVTIPEAPVLSVPSGLVASDDEATTNADTPVTVDVLANDTFNDEPITLDELDGPPTIHQQPANGTVSVAPDGKITYTPNPGFTGTDEFVYRIAMPDEEVCIKLRVVDAEGRIEVIGDAPSWFDPQEAGFDLRWEHDGSSGQNHWAFDGSLFFPLSWPPLPETCESSFSAMLSQVLPDPDADGGTVMREVNACIETWCMG